MSIQTMAESLAARDAGIASSEAHAEADAPGWQDMAYGWLTHYVEHKRFPFIMEDFRSWLTAMGKPQPAELRAYGALTVRAIRSKLIERIGYAPAASSHGSAKPLYRRHKGE